MLSVVWIAFAAMMIVAFVIDVISYRIPNTLVVALVALFLVVSALNWSEVEWLGHIAAAILIFGVGIFLYAIRQMGAGDVKLLGAVALWAGAVPPFENWPSPVIVLLFYVALCGFLGMVVILALRLIVPRLQPITGQRPVPRVLTKGQGIPYAIAIGPGAIIASFSFAPWLWSF